MPGRYWMVSCTGGDVVLLAARRELSQKRTLQTLVERANPDRAALFVALCSRPDDTSRLAAQLVSLQLQTEPGHPAPSSSVSLSRQQSPGWSGLPHIV